MFENFWLIASGLALFGSVSFGYLVLRFSIPDIRTVTREQKLGLSGIVGLALFGISFGLSSLFAGFSFLFFLPLLALVFSAFFELKNMFFSKDVMLVAVPVARVTKQLTVKAEEMEMPAFAFGKELEEKPAPIEARSEEARVLEDRVFEVPENPREEMLPAGRTEEILKKSREEERKEHRVRRKAAEEYAKSAEQKEFIEGRLPEEAAAKAAQSGRDRYLQRRGQLVEEVKADLMKTKEQMEMELPPELAKREISLEEITGGIDVSELEKIGSLSELGEIGEISSIEELGNLDLSELGGIASLQTVAKEKGMHCPQCNSSKGTMVYCPACGKGFCSNCSTKVEAKQDLIFLGCPHCKKEVIIKKA